MKTLLLTCGEAMLSPLLTHSRTRSRVHGLDIYALPEHDLNAYAGLLIPIHADQRFLMTVRPQLEEFLQAGGTVVICGHVAYPILPELSPFVPLARRSPEDYRVWRMSEHPVFAGVQTDDLTFRKGVPGFYGRGHNPPPSHAHILHRLGSLDGAPVDYLYDRPDGGRVLIHAGNDLWMYVADDTTAARVAPQLLAWIESTGGPGETQRESRP